MVRLYMGCLYKLVCHRDFHRADSFGGRNLHEVYASLEGRNIEFRGFCINIAAGVNRLSYKVHDIQTCDGVIAPDVHEFICRVRVNHDLTTGQFIHTYCREINRDRISGGFTKR